MTVGELIELLEQYPEEAEVRLATQPSWPLQATIRGVVSNADIAEEPEEEAAVVWIVEQSQVHDMPYAPRAVFDF